MPHARTHHDGFTLIELTAVMVLVAILAITAIPAVQRLSAVHEASLAQEVARRLTLARTHATTTGIPTGVRIDLAQQRMPFVVAGPNGIQELRSGLDGGEALRSDRLANASGAAITAVAIPSANAILNANPQNTIWFDYKGTPHLRTPNGTPIASIPGPATITVADAFIVAIHPSTGHIAVHRGAAQ